MKINTPQVVPETETSETIDNTSDDVMGSIGRQFNTACEIQPPRLPARRRSSSYKSKSWMNGLDDSTMKVIDDFEEDNDQHDKVDSRNVPCSTTQEATCSSAPCSSVYIISSESDTALSSRLTLTEDTVREFLYDYHGAFATMYGSQTLDSWRCFVKKFYTPEFQYIRPSGNPIRRDDFAISMAAEMKWVKIEVVSIDSVTILSCMRSAVATYTAEHFFEYKGILNEDRCTITCVLEMVEGEIKVVQEHRSSGISVPKETRWKPE